MSAKVSEICRLIPAIEKEIIWDTRGTKARTSQTKDNVIYTFKNGSTLENIAATEKSRGRRFQSGLNCSSLKIFLIAGNSNIIFTTIYLRPTYI